MVRRTTRLRTGRAIIVITKNALSAMMMLLREDLEGARKLSAENREIARGVMPAKSADTEP